MFVRCMDKTGRIAIPAELRRKLKLKTIDLFEISIKGKCITIKKYEDICDFCGNTKKLIDFKEKKICKECLEELKNVDNN